MRKVNQIMGTATMSVLATAGVTGVAVSDMGCATLDAAKGGLEAGKGAMDKIKGQMPKGAKGADGDDNDRLHAVEGEYGKPIDDAIDYKAGDKEDWRKFNLIGKPGTATFELHWDDDKAELSMDVFNENGTLVGKSPPRLEGQSTKRIIMKVDKPGLFYVKVSGAEKKDKSIYTMSVKWDGAPAKGDKGQAQSDKDNPQPQADKGAAGGDKAAADKAAADKAAADKAAADKAVADKAAADKAAADKAAAPPTPFAQDPNKVVGNIVSAYKEGGTWTLQIDRGSGNKLRTGMTGNLLEGPEGDKMVDGGAFTISQVLDGTKAIGKSFMKNPPGKNKRVVIHLVK